MVEAPRSHRTIAVDEREYELMLLELIKQGGPQAERAR